MTTDGGGWCTWTRRRRPPLAAALGAAADWTGGAQRGRRRWRPLPRTGGGVPFGQGAVAPGGP